MFNDNYYSATPKEEPEEPVRTDGKAKIRVIGVGGAGNNAVNRMIEAGITSAEFIAVNTDAQILACSKAPTKIQIGTALTKGLGAGSDPKIGRDAAEDSKKDLESAIEGTDLLFITAGMGGGTGTGAAPVIAKIAKERKILTVAVVTKPFEFEGKRRMDNALDGIANLKNYVDTIIIVPNEKISEVVPQDATLVESYRVADEVLMQGIRGIADVIAVPSLMNLDFADVRTVLKGKGMAHMGVGVAKGENRIVDAVRLAVNSPLLDTTIEGATSVLFNVVAGDNLTLTEVKKAAGLVRGVVDYNALIKVGACIDNNINEEVAVTVIATGFPSPQEPYTETSYPQPQERSEASSPFRMPQQFPKAEERPAPMPVVPEEQPIDLPEEPMPIDRAQETVDDRYDEEAGKGLPAFMKKLLGRKNNK